MKPLAILGMLLFITVLTACKNSSADRVAVDGKVASQNGAQLLPAGNSGDTAQKITRSDAEWKQILTSEQYEVLRQKGTEAPFTGAYVNNHEKGIYSCAACDLPLFNSDAKFESGTGWPSFWQPINKVNVHENVDESHGMTRTEVVCNRCGGHLGHLFDDGPEPTHLRYCINSVSLKFTPTK